MSQKKPKDSSVREAVLKTEASYSRKVFDEKPAEGYFDAVPDLLRLSNLLKKLKAMGEEGEHSYETIQKLYKEVGNNCAVHGELVDPIVGLIGEQVAFICPWCSGPEMLAAWEAEDH